MRRCKHAATQQIEKEIGSHAGRAFEFDKVSFAYSGHKVFDRFNLIVNAGEFLAIVGGNGSGKSTLLRLGVRALRPDQGQIRIFGQPVQTYRRWHKVGYVPQNPLRDKFFPATVEEIVAMGRTAGLGIGRRLRSKDRDIVDGVLQLVDMLGFRQQMIGRLSGGQQQRVMVARALAAEPEILILDEPTAGIDAKGSENFYQLLKGLHDNTGITILLVSHDTDRVSKYADNILNLDHGREEQTVAAAYIP